jgi:hypothetical protein
LIILSILMSFLFLELSLPGALMLGPMAAAIALGVLRSDIHVHRIPFGFAQGVVGCMVAQSLTPAVMHAFWSRGVLFVSIVLSIIVFNCAMGWFLSHSGAFPGTTAVWGLLPGAASSMIIMAESCGADVRLVAFIQYLRVVMVGFFASFVAHFNIHHPIAGRVFHWFPEVLPLPFGETMTIILVGTFIGYFLRISGGMLLIPLFAGSILQAGGLASIMLPGWLLASAYMCIGWTVGLRFRRDVLLYAARMIPRAVLSIFVVIVFCGFLGYLLNRFLGVDPLTAYLATSPGGVDAVAIIATSANVKVGFVMALQLSRMLLVVLIGPLVSRWVAVRVQRSRMSISENESEESGK